MLYLLDANSLITANNDYYPIDRVPEYWSWLIHMGKSGAVKMPREIHAEVTPGETGFLNWINDTETKDALILDGDVDAALLRRVADEGYGQNLNSIEVQLIGKDPFLIAYALADSEYRTVVTKEVSKPGAERANRKIPDVAAQFDVRSITDHQLIQELDFRTNWNGVAHRA